MVVRCEKLGPMHWRVFPPGREPFDLWAYVLVGPDGVEHSDTFEATVDA